MLDVRPIEVGVVMRLLSLYTPGRSDREVAATLWRWSQTRRLDFDGVGTHGLAAALPRLDGRASEELMWTAVDPNALSEMAAGTALHEVVTEIVASATKDGAVVIRRPAIGLSEPADYHIKVDAAPLVRARRKLRQLQSMQARSIGHDWFNPRLNVVPLHHDWKIDTTEMSTAGMYHLAAMWLDDAFNRRVHASGM
jgi:cytidylate kinase